MFLPISDDVEKDHLPITGFVLMIANIYVWGYMIRMIMDDPTYQSIADLYQNWGCVPKDLAQGKIVGLFTSMFIHGGFDHLLGNMLFMWTLMWSLEAALGWQKFLPFYIAVGLISGVAQAAINFQSDIPCIGASGAISGMLGAYLIKFGLWTRFKLLFFLFWKPITFHVPSWAFGLFWIGMQFYGHFNSDPNEPGVGWMCHISGFFAGMVLFYLLDEEDAELDGEKGELRIRTRKQLEEEARASEQDEQYVYRHASIDELDESGCLYCQTPLTEESKIGANLYRCPNTECGYLNIRKEQPVTADR